MSPEDHNDALKRILEEQEELRNRLAALDRDIADLKAARALTPATETAEPEEPAPVEASPPEKEPPAPPPVPPAIPVEEPVAEKSVTPEGSPEDTPAPAESAKAPPTEPVQAAAGEGFEFKLGTYWLVRIGIVMVLTGFVFLAKDFLTNDEVAPGLKVTALYLLSFGLLGAGAFVEKTRESMRNYGQVLGAGGLAAVYFTTFAAHKVPALAVISSNIVAGLLLLLWAAFMVVLADRKRSQTLAVMGVLLAYYTLLIDEVSLFSLWSALILSGVALIFLVRNRWTIVGSLSLAGTYIAFAYWRFPELLSWLNNAPASHDSFWPQYGFLICYWAVFTAAVFLSDHLEQKQRATFAGLNNAAFLVFFGLGMGRHFPDEFWIFAFAAGVVFLVLAELADRRLGRGALLGTIYLAKGIGLITLAFFIKLSGYSLAILIAAESCALLIVATRRDNKVLEAGAYISALLAVWYTLMAETNGPTSLWFVEITDGVPALAAFAQFFFLATGAWWLRNRASEALPAASFDPRATLFLVLGIAAVLIGAYNDIAEDSRGLVFLGLGAGAAALGSWRRLRLAELAVLGQAFSAVAIITHLSRLTDTSAALSLTPSLCILLLILGLLHWAHSPRGPVPGMGVRPLFAWAFAAAWSLCLVLTIEHEFDPGAAWLYLPGILATLQLFYGHRARIPALAVLSQFYHPIVFLEYDFNESWFIGLLPLVLLLINIFAADLLRRRAEEESHSESTHTLIDAGLCLLRVLALFFFTAFVFEHIHEPWRPFAFALAALAVHGIAIRYNDRQRFVFALLLLSVSVLMILLRALNEGLMEAWQLYAAALAPLAMQQLTRRHGGPAAKRPAYHWILACAGVALTWLAVSVDVDSMAEGFYLIASWSLLGLLVFAAGWFLRERLYRILSLILLGAALARLLAIEVWSLDPLPRIITFILIGLVLLALGFVYTRFQEKLKQIF